MQEETIKNLNSEELEIILRVKNGVAGAEDELKRTEERFVVKVAEQYKNQGLDLAELINEGNSGLIEAAKRFDSTKGIMFMAYAVWWVRQSILVALARKSYEKEEQPAEPTQKNQEASNTPIDDDIEAALSILTDRERGIFQMLFGIGQSERSLDEVAAAYSIPRERVSQIKTKAIRRLRESGNKSIQEYIG